MLGKVGVEQSIGARTNLPAALTYAHLIFRVGAARDDLDRNRSVSGAAARVSLVPPRASNRRIASSETI